MKKIAILFILCSFATVLFGGCDLLNKKEEAQAPQPVQEISADSLLDNQIYGQAVGLNDAKICDKILDENKKEECKNVIEALFLTDKAKEELNEDYCDDITIERYEENCKSAVEQKTAEEEIATIEQERIEEITTIAQKAADNNDASICEKIEEEDMMYSCKKNIIINKALQAGDSKICAELEKDEYIRECEEEIK